MPYSVSKGGGTCGDSEWAVLAEGGRTMGCHGSKGAALDQQAALYANDADDDDDDGGDGSTSSADTTPHAPRGRMMASRHVTADAEATRRAVIFPPPATRDRHSPHHG
jgi:hypothetical protein